MANYDNGLSPVTKLEGEISAINIDKMFHKEADDKRSITNITLDKTNISTEKTEKRKITNISLEKNNLLSTISWNIESICVDKTNTGICLGGFL